jgi:hypothetical protein
MVSSGLLHRVALVRTDVSEEPGASFIRVTKISELGTTQAAASNRRTLRRNTNLVFLRSVPSSPIFVTLMKEAQGSSETSVLTRATRRNNPEDTILHRNNASSPVIVTLMKEMRRSSATSVLTRATRRNISEDTILLILIPSYFIFSLILLSPIFFLRHL